MSEQNFTKGPVAWMATNSVAANLLMLTLVVGGTTMLFNVKQEVMPEFQMSIITISVPYPGASPAEVEQGIILAIEEGVRGFDGIKKVSSTASEGMASVRVELTEKTDAGKSLQDIKNAVDRITTFPQDSERPIVQLLNNRREVISLILFGDLDESSLRLLAEDVRDDLLAFDDITEVSLLGIRPREIKIEVPHESLRAHKLTLDQIAAMIRTTAVELPAGGVKTKAGEILIRTAERRDYGHEFADIPVVSTADGSTILLKDIATIQDDFRETDQAAYFNDQRSVRIAIARVGDQKPMQIAARVKEFAATLEQTLPPGVGVASWFDASEMFADRSYLLAKNAFLGLVLVLLILGMFLEIRLAFWVMAGIPISMLGAFLLFPQFEVSINMISLFAFIISLGIVVDDAVVVGENIYEMRERGFGRLEAAIRGVRGVLIPVTFSILSNIVAFAPLLFVPGFSGKFFRVIPITVIAVFLMSLIESLFILPAHLAHQKPSPTTGYRGALRRGQRRIGKALERFVERRYKPILEATLKNRYLAVACALAFLMVSVGVVKSGMVQFTFMPTIDTDLVTANASLAFGAPAEDTLAVSKRLLEAAKEVIATNGGDAICRGILTDLGSNIDNNQGPATGGSSNGGHLTAVSVYLVSAEHRSFSASEFARQWREKVNNLTGLETLSFQYSTGPAAGRAINMQLSHKNIEVLEAAGASLAMELSTYAGVKDINDGFERGKPQIDFTLKPESSALGLTSAAMGTQLRAAFYGARAFRQQRGREEIWVMVRLPETERRSIWNVNNLMIRTPAGGELPITEAAHLEMGYAYTKIKRVDGRRVVNVTSDLDLATANANDILDDISTEVMPELLARYPGLVFSLEGDRRRQQESMQSLLVGFMLAMLVVFAMLAIPFKSYLQPFVVMAAIPFGVVGAIGGHMVMGYNLSIISIMGIVALSGVVVNDSLVFIHATNENRAAGKSIKEALLTAGMRRFRPILLTSLTTFFGLMPMMFETSVQARFLIPMAISLGFGVLAATFITLLIVPAFYSIIVDLKALYRKELTVTDSA